MAQPGAGTSGRAVARANTYCQRGDWFRLMPQFNRDSTVGYYNKALHLLNATRPQPTAALAQTYQHVASYYLRCTDYRQARLLANKAAQWASVVPTPALLRYRVRRTQAFAELNLGQPKQGLQQLLEGIALLQNDPSPDIQTMLLRDKGLCYAKYQDQVGANVGKDIHFLRQSCHYYQRRPQAIDPVDLADIYSALMVSYNIREQFDSCAYYADKLHALLPVLRMPDMYVRYYADRGNMLSRQQRHNQAKLLIDSSLYLCKSYNLTFLRKYPFSLNLMGVLLRGQGQYDKAMTYFSEARNAAVTIGTANVQRDYLVHMIDLHKAKGDYKSALAYAEQYAGEAKQVAEAFSLNSLREHELKISLLQKETQLARQQTERQAFRMGLVAAGLLTVLLAVVGFGLYRRSQTRQRTNQHLAMLNTNLAKRNAENELLLKEIHHRVKNNLELVASLLSLQSARISDPDVQEAMRASQNRVQSMGILHQKLYQTEHLASVEMKNYFRSLSETILGSYDATDLVTVDLPMAPINLDADRAISVGLIVNELLTNSLKYAFPPGTSGRIRLGRIRLGLAPGEGDLLTLTVADNGVGKTVNSVAHGTGFGTQLVELLTRQLDGTLRQQVNNGTTITIQFPRKLRD